MAGRLARRNFISSFHLRHGLNMDEPIIDLQSDAHFMGEALRHSPLSKSVP
jgi:hypothetical protein